MAIDHIEALAASHEKQFSEKLMAVLSDLLATINIDELAAALDDTDADHIRDQLALILDLDEHGEPESLGDAFAPIAALLVSFMIAVAAHAGAQARHVVNHADAMLKDALTAAPGLLRSFQADTARAISAAIEAALYGPGTPQSRAAQLKRSIGLTVRQAASLETMREAMQAFLDTPRQLIPAHTDAIGRRVRPSYERRADTRAILASTRGKISAAQKQILTRALANAKLTQADADAILDRHATAMRRFRVRAVAAEGIHLLAETAKLTGWQIAQHFGALPQGQRRYWRTAGDERVRHAHAQVPSMNSKGVLLNQPFQTPLGAFMTPPLEYGCRCRSVLGRGV